MVIGVSLNVMRERADMPSTIANSVQSHLVPHGDKPGPKPSAAKAGLRPRTPEPEPEAVSFTYGESIWEVLVKGHGSVKATAITMGNRDRSLLRREVLDGSLTLAQLMQADPKALAAFGEFLMDTFGDSKKCKAQIARERLPEMFALILDAITEQKL